MSLGGALLLLAPPAAQAVPPPDIIVTGERVPRSTADTASSVVVTDRDALERLAGADRLDDLLRATPNVQVGSGGEGATIRGQDSTGIVRDLPAFLGGTRPRTTLQVDGRPADYFEYVFGLASLWDVERVELFRSAQTITQGRNAIAGAIFVTTADPSFEPAGRVRAIGATGGRRQFSAMATGPLSADVALRLTADWGRDRPASEIVDTQVGAEPDIDKQRQLRLKLLARPSDGVKLVASFSHGTSQAPQIVGLRAPFKARRDPEATYGVFGNRITAATLEAEARLAAGLEASSTVTFSRSRFERFAPVGLGQAVVHKSIATLESVVRWAPGDRLRLLGGVHVLRERIDQRIDISQLKGVGQFEDRQGSSALFGAVEWKPLSRLRLELAARLQADSQDRSGEVVGSGAPITLDYRGRFNALLPRLTLGWSAGGDLTLGAMIQKGHNPGGATLLLTGEVDRFDAERMWAAELYARGRAFDRRARWSINLFHQRFSDAQRPQTIEMVLPNRPPVLLSRLDNAPRAWSRGLEAEIDWTVTRAVRLKAGLGLLDTKIVETRLASDPIRGREFQRAPGLSGTLALEWTPIEPLRLSASARGRNGYFSDDANTPSRRIGGGVIVDAKARYDLGKPYVAAYVRNALNRFQLTYLFSRTFATAESPREVGIELGMDF